MSNDIRIQASHEIDAPPQAIYNVIADYRVGHQAILPRPAFEEMVVEEGGFGAGTVIRLRVRIFGKAYFYHQRVTEPEPGRVIQETDIDTGQLTRFFIDPLNNGQRTRVTIYSEFPAQSKAFIFLERIMHQFITKRLFNIELRQLEAFVKTQAGVQAVG